MSHPALDPDAVARLQATVGVAPPAEPEAAVEPAPPAPAPRWSAAHLKALARRAAAPAVARVRVELARAAADDHHDLRVELAELRSELARTRAEHDAELAVLHEELADRDARREPRADAPVGT